jgi:DNA (cytosine-5)-methyltransferase 1
MIPYPSHSCLLSIHGHQLPANKELVEQPNGPFAWFRNASYSPALSTASSHTLGRTPTPSPAPSRVRTLKRPLESSPVQNSPGTPSKRPRVALPSPPVVCLDDGAITIDSDDDVEEDEIVEHGLDLEQHRREREARIRNRYQKSAQPQGRRVPILVRNAPVQHPFSEIPSYEWNGTPLRAGKTVELVDGSFLHIKAVIHNPYELNDNGSHVVLLRGWQLRRCTDLNGLLPKGLNELCYVYEVDMDDPRPVQEQSVLEVALADVLKVRQLIRTNQPFPQCRFSNSDLPQMPTDQLMQYVRDEERLVVRWKFTTIFPNTQDRVAFEKKQSYLLPTIRKVESLTEAECTKGYHAPAQILRHAWRGDTIPGGFGQKPERKNDPEPELDPVECPNCGEEFADAVRLVKHHEAAHQKGKQRATIVLSDNEARASPQIRHSTTIENMRQRLESVISLDEDVQASGRKIPKEKRRYTLGDGCKSLQTLWFN